MYYNRSEGSSLEVTVEMEFWRILSMAVHRYLTKSFNVFDALIITTSKSQ